MRVTKDLKCETGEVTSVQFLQMLSSTVTQMQAKQIFARSLPNFIQISSITGRFNVKPAQINIMIKWPIYC